ncbi:MAG TPA: PEP-CTERM sorting domain-containing protein, partial [Opitutaceae bacterium]
GTTGITFGSNVALTLNLVGANIITANTPYVLIAGTGSGAGLNSSQFLGLTSSGTINGNTILSNFTLSFTGSQPPSWYSNSYVFLSANGQDIEVEVVPEPGTWALILGGFGVLFFWQRRKARQIQ